MKIKYLRLSVVVVFLVACIGYQSASGQDRFIDCRKFDKSIKITIDGNGSDWPISSYGSPALMSAPLGDVITGDHFVIDPSTANYDNQGNTNAYTGKEDQDATTYIGWDDNAFYVLNIAKDDKIGFEHANADTIDADGYFTGNSTGWTNDGIEFWLDNDNNREPPSIDADQTSVNDLQFDVLIDDALQRRDFPTIPEEEIGIVTSRWSYQYKEFFRWGSDKNDGGDLEFELLTKIQTATKLDADNKGYTMEIRIPFGEIEMFEPTHPIGFNISWIDWDDGAFSHMIWNGGVDAQAADYKELRFTSDRPLGGTTPVTLWPLY